jgi:hypothetical protein
MKLSEIKAALRSHPLAYPRFTLPDGDQIPAHFHITEVGYVTKRFIDCGGMLHDRNHTCVLQTWLGDDVDHRLKAGTLAKILDLGAQVIPHDDLDVAIEYDCCVVSQYPISSAEVVGDNIEFQLGQDGTDCLARRRHRQAVGAAAALETACC